MHPAIRKCLPLALAAAIALPLGAVSPLYAHADTHSSTALTLSRVDNPFDAGKDQHLTVSEGSDITLNGEISGGFGEVHFQWLVSTDGEKTWEEIDGACGKSFEVRNAQRGDYVYRLVATDAYGNTASQDFFVTVVAGAENPAEAAADAVSKAVKTGDALPVAGILSIAALAGGLALRASRKRRDKVC